jgi:hypothetical protein
MEASVQAAVDANASMDIGTHEIIEIFFRKESN